MIVAEHGRKRPVDDPVARERKVRERFPGVKRVDWVRVLVHAAPARGACWSEASPLPESKIAASWALRGEGKRNAAALDALVRQGWTRIYRSPKGDGMEQRAAFESLALEIETSLRCRCAPSAKIVEGEAAILFVRIRWREGGMPEVGGEVRRSDGRRDPMAAAITVGSVPTFDMEAEGSFPERGAGACRAEISVEMLVDPPIL